MVLKRKELILSVERSKTAPGERYEMTQKKEILMNSNEHHHLNHAHTKVLNAIKYLERIKEQKILKTKEGSDLHKEMHSALKRIMRTPTFILDRWHPSGDSQ